LIYVFLVEKAYIIRQSTVPKPRLKSKLYLFNSFGMLGVYVVVSVLNFIFRITRQKEGECVIGMQRVAMIPLITFDLLVNVYLTVLFLLPLRTLYGFRHIQRNPANERLRTVAFRTFIGSVATTLSSITNLSVLMALDGEPGWVCLMCCNLDIAFSAMVVHWVTSKDKTAVFQPSATSAYAKGVVSVYQLESETGAGGAGAGPSSSPGGHSPRNMGGFRGVSSSSNNKVMYCSGGCVHECKPGTGCYGAAANKDLSAITGAVTLGTGSNAGTTAAVHQRLPAAPPHKAVPRVGSHGHGLGLLNYANVVVDKDGQPVNKAFMTPEAIAMYHYNHYRYMNGGSSNRYPFTKSSSVTGGTLENTRSDTSSKYSEFRKYGGRLFADNIDPLELDEGEERDHSSDEDCEYELVLRKKKRSRTPPILPAELDPVVSNSRPGSRKWSVARETTLVVESTAAVDAAGATPQLKSSSGAVFGTRTVCLGGGEHHENGECSSNCRQHATAAGAGSSSVVGAVAGSTSRLKKAGKRHSRNTSGVPSEDGEAAAGSSSVRTGKKEVSWLDAPDTRTSADFEREGNDFMWDGTQGDRSARVEPDIELARYDSQESILQLRLEEI